MSGATRQAQLRALEAQFYEQFAVPGQATSHEEEDSDEMDEQSVADEDEEEGDGDEEGDDGDEGGSDLDDDKDLLLAARTAASAAPPATKPTRRVPETVVFTDPSSSRTSAPISKQARKQFMVRILTNLVLRH